MNASWFCNLHRISTTSDCPQCDAEQIAELERGLDLPWCRVCGRTLQEGETAWMSGWKVIEPGGVRIESRYTCDECEAAT